MGRGKCAALPVIRTNCGDSDQNISHTPDVFIRIIEQNKQPIHVHVQRERSVCKFWLEPIALAHNHGFSARELSRIRAIIQEELTKIQEAWREHCG